ncbi:MAG: hypothetical protein Q7R81_01000 [Candidatus Peregrinibacteria bacterium]|nr:hypothetical protein [Candidatus Peregrinibacteria bacterium]
MFDSTGEPKVDDQTGKTVAKEESDRQADVRNMEREIKDKERTADYKFQKIEQEKEDKNASDTESARAKVS